MGRQAYLQFVPKDILDVVENPLERGIGNGIIGDNAYIDYTLKKRFYQKPVIPISVNNPN